MIVNLSRRAPAGESLRAAELAWVVEHLGRIGIRCRDEGWCVGELLPSELVLEGDGLTRGTALSRFRQWDQAFRAARHRQKGHDAGCRALGVPRSVLERLLVDCAAGPSARYLLEGIDQVILELTRSETQRIWTVEFAAEELELAMRRRITAFRPSADAWSLGCSKAAVPRWVHAAFEMMWWWISTRGSPRTVRPPAESSSV